MSRSGAVVNRISKFGVTWHRQSWPIGELLPAVNRSAKSAQCERGIKGGVYFIPTPSLNHVFSVLIRSGLKIAEI